MGLGALLKFNEAASEACLHGLCYDRNVLLRDVLQHLLPIRPSCLALLGARTRFFSERKCNRLFIERGGALQDLPFDHVCLLIQVNDCDGVKRDYLLDVGNGAPYFQPLLLPDTTRDDSPSEWQNGHIAYRVAANQRGPEWFEVQHLRPAERSEWRGNYLFCRTDVLNMKDVTTIVNRHTTDPSFGHMLTSIRLNKRSLKHNAVILRDGDGRVVGPNGADEEREDLRTWEQLLDFVGRHFGDEFVTLLLQAAPVLRKYLSIIPNPALSKLLPEV